MRRNHGLDSPPDIGCSTLFVLPKDRQLPHSVPAARSYQGHQHFALTGNWVVRRTEHRRAHRHMNNFGKRSCRTTSQGGFLSFLLPLAVLSPNRPMLHLAKMSELAFCNERIDLLCGHSIRLPKSTSTISLQSSSLTLFHLPVMPYSPSVFDLRCGEHHLVR